MNQQYQELKLGQYFAVHPFPWQADINNLQEQTILLQEVLGKSEQEVYKASKAYIGNSQGLMKFLFAVRGWRNLMSEINDKAETLPFAITIFAIEAISSHLPGNTDRAIQYLDKFLSREEKTTLLLAIAVDNNKDNSQIPFTNNFPRHFTYQHASITYELSEYCATKWGPDEIATTCSCDQWLRSATDQEIDTALAKLSKYLYKIRCAITHDSMSPLILIHDPVPDSPTKGSSCLDLITDYKKNKATQFYTSLHRDTLLKIFKNSLWKAFSSGWPLNSQITK